MQCPQLFWNCDCTLHILFKWVGDCLNVYHYYFKSLFSFSAVNPSTCSSTGSEKLAKYFNRKVTTLQPGSPCNDFKGYCDVFMRCRLVDADGPLARLKKAIFNPELYENIAEWIVVSVPDKTVWNKLPLQPMIMMCKHNCAICIDKIVAVISLVFFLNTLSYFFHCSGSLVGCAVDGHRSYYADGGLHPNLQCPHPQQQSQTSPTKNTVRYRTQNTIFPKSVSNRVSENVYAVLDCANVTSK